MARGLLGLTLLLSGVPSRAAAQSFELIGARALGMGGAFVAVADDATATYWNPAGLVNGSLFGGSIDSSGFEQLPHDARESASPGALSQAGRGFSLTTLPLGLSYYRLRITEVEAESDARQFRSLVANQFGVSLTQSLTERLSVGSTIKIVRGSAATGPTPSPGPTTRELLRFAESVDGESSTTIDADVGVMLSFDRARVGLVARNLREPDFEDDSGSSLKLRRQIRAGVAVLLTRDLAVAIDADLRAAPTVLGDYRPLAVGIERWLFNQRLALRAGARASTSGGARTVGTLGVSVVSISTVLAEAALVRGDDGSPRGWAISGRVTF